MVEFLFNWNDCFGGANVGASSAVRALFRVDDVNGVALADGFLGTFSQASITSNTFVGNLVSHEPLLLITTLI